MAKKKRWTDAEEQVLIEQYADTDTADIASQLGRTNGQVYLKANAMGLRKSKAYISASVTQQFLTSGKRYRFPRGHKTWNKGTKGIHLGGEKTRFKPGHIPPNYEPVGTIKEDGHGYLKIKIADPRTWEYLNRFNWEKAYGPIPENMLVAFKNGDNTDCSPENLVLISKLANLQRNSLHNYPADLRSVIQIRAGLIRRINHKRRQNG